MKRTLAALGVITVAGVHGLAQPTSVSAEPADGVARRATTRIPGTMRPETLFSGRQISKIRTRVREVRKCFDECQKRSNCDGVTYQAKRNRNATTICTLYTNITKKLKVRGWTSWTPVQRCARHSECDDRNECNGTERCAEDSGSLRCQPGKDRCASNEDCVNRRCVRRCYDRDGDGHKDMSCGGDDCNDRNGRVYAGNYESCNSVDEDCDPCTVGTTDADRDGHVSSACSNPVPRSTMRCSKAFVDSARKIARGRDCDDSNPAIGPGSMICDSNAAYVKLCVDGAWQRRPCPSGTRCIRQPDGRGTCQR